jgi:hypothetical protein
MRAQGSSYYVCVRARGGGGGGVHAQASRQGAKGMHTLCTYKHGARVSGFGFRVLGQRVEGRTGVDVDELENRILVRPQQSTDTRHLAGHPA